MSDDVDKMTANEVAAELRRLSALAESGEITAAQARRMERLRSARFACQEAKRPWFV